MAGLLYLWQWWDSPELVWKPFPAALVALGSKKECSFYLKPVSCCCTTKVMPAIGASDQRVTWSSENRFRIPPALESIHHQPPVAFDLSAIPGNPHFLCWLGVLFACSQRVQDQSDSNHHRGAKYQVQLKEKLVFG